MNQDRVDEITRFFFECCLHGAQYSLKFRRRLALAQSYKWALEHLLHSSVEFKTSTLALLDVMNLFASDATFRRHHIEKCVQTSMKFGVHTSLAFFIKYADGKEHLLTGRFVTVFVRDEDNVKHFLDLKGLDHIFNVYFLCEKVFDDRLGVKYWVNFRAQIRQHKRTWNRWSHSWASSSTFFPYYKPWKPVKIVNPVRFIK
jgi:hypothetical protein